jgi:hypothetical protein
MSDEENSPPSAVIDATQESALSATASRLRGIVSKSSADGREFDVKQMEQLLSMVMQRLRAINQDATAFLANGGHNTELIKAWVSMLNAAGKLVADLNKMRSNDKTTNEVLVSHTKTLSAGLAVPLGEELRTLHTKLSNIRSLASTAGVERQVIAARLEELEGDLVSMVSVRLVRLFNDAANQALRTTRDGFKISD